jgi:hypothetical protein
MMSKQATAKPEAATKTSTPAAVKPVTPKATAPAAPSAAYRGPGDDPHMMWALWREESYVHVQAHTILPSELDSAFDPSSPYVHVGERIHVAENGLPIPEWRIELVHLIASALGIRWPIYPR